MTSHDTGSTGTPETPHATAPPARTFGPQGPTLGELSDAYLQDYQVRQFRSQSTARDRIAHLVAFFGRDAHAAALTTPVPTRPARRRGGHRHHQSGNLGPPPHVHPRRPLGLARHRARLPRPPAGESPPPRLLRTPRIPRRPRPPARPVAGHPRPCLLLRLAQERDPRPHLGRNRRGRRRHPALARPLEDVGGADSPDLTTHCRGPGGDGGHAATPTARSSSTATASPSAAGARRGAPPVRRPAYRPASSTIAAAPPPAT